jgi:hypothetical protein
MFKLSEIVTVPFNFNNSAKSSIYWAKNLLHWQTSNSNGKKNETTMLEADRILDSI